MARLLTWSDARIYRRHIHERVFSVGDILRHLLAKARRLELGHTDVSRKDGAAGNGRKRGVCGGDLEAKVDMKCLMGLE